MTASAVFVIDDSVAVREVISIAFRRQNINVCAFGAGEPACRQMECTVPDLVISDINMPGQDGFAVCEFVKKHPRLHQTPVILISGMVDKAVADRAFAVKADELIRKPFQPQELVDRARQLIARRRLVVMPAPAAQPIAQPVPAAQMHVAGEAHPAVHAPSYAEPWPNHTAAVPHARPAAPSAFEPGLADPAEFDPVSAGEQELRMEVARLQNLVRELREALRRSKEDLCLLAERVMNNREG